VYRTAQEGKAKARAARLAEENAKRAAEEEAKALAKRVAAEAARLEQERILYARKQEAAEKHAEELAAARQEHILQQEKEEAARVQAETERRLQEVREEKSRIQREADKRTAEELARGSTPVKSPRPLSQAQVNALSPKELRAELERYRPSTLHIVVRTLKNATWPPASTKTVAPRCPFADSHHHRLAYAKKRSCGECCLR
jgi:hypothetical protein